MSNLTRNQKRGEQLKGRYKRWKEWKLEREDGFFPIWSDFLDVLPKLSGGALRLYIFLGLVSKNWTGESWYPVKKIQEKLGCSERSIQKWFKELQEQKLIVRFQHRLNGVSFTYLLPYSKEPSRKKRQKEESSYKDEEIEFI
ncbi:MAG TPA: helix-turn-helix domain-containing protein [Limnochordales bacterium]